VGVVVLAHVVACALLLASGGGTELEADLLARRRWIEANATLWTATWIAWGLSSLSIGAFFAVWTARLAELGAARGRLGIALVLGLAGIPFDLAGETFNLTQPGRDPDAFERAARLYTLLGPAIANGLYCVAGLVLSREAWRVGFLRGTAGAVGVAMWSVGCVLTVAALLASRVLVVASGAGVMALFVPWAAVVGRRLRASANPT
jgi:hypothetical protein